MRDRGAGDTQRGRQQRRAQKQHQNQGAGALGAAVAQAAPPKQKVKVVRPRRGAASVSVPVPKPSPQEARQARQEKNDEQQTRAARRARLATLPPLGPTDFLRSDQQARAQLKKQLDTMPQANIGNELDTLGKYTVGLGLVKPSHAPGNVLEHLGIDTSLPHDAAPHTVSAETARKAAAGDPEATKQLEASASQTDVGMVPFLPGSLVGHGLQDALGETRLARSASSLLRKQEKAVAKVGKEMASSPTRQAAHAHFEATSATPEEAAAKKQVYDNRLIQLAKEHADSPKALKQLTAHLQSGGIDQFHGYPEERVAANLRSKLNPRNAEKGLPQNPRVRRGGVQVLGPITPRSWLKRVEKVMPTRAERQKWAKWYDEVKPLFDRTFGNDSDRILRGFAVSQANASPTSGLEAVLRVVDKLDRGQPIKSNEISAVVKSIEAAVKGDPVEKGVAAKLSDFIDSLRGTDTRTWMGHAAEGGAPAAIDVHALRDLGYVDPKIVSRLEKLNLKVGHDFVVDSPGVAKGPMYERASEQYHAITDHLNQIGFDGRSDWKPAEVQALGWAAIQKLHGSDPEDLLYAIDRNTRTVSAEVSGIGRFAGNELPSLDTRSMPYERGHALTQAVIEQVTPDLADAAGVRIRGIDYGPGGYLEDVTPSSQIHVLGSPEQVERFRDLLGATLHQWEVWAIRPATTGKRAKVALELVAPEFSDAAKVESWWRALQANATEEQRGILAGFAPFKTAEGDGVRIITPSGYMQPGKRDAFLAKFKDLIEKTNAEEGVNARATLTHVEVRAGESGGNGVDYLARLEGTLGPGVRGLVDRAHAEAVDLFQRGLAATDPGVAAKVPRSRPQGLASGIPIGGDEDAALININLDKGAEPAAQKTAEELAAEKGLEGLKGAPAAYREQQAQRGEELGRRIGAAKEAMDETDGSFFDKVAAAKEQLRGTLPKVEHNGLRGLTTEEFNALGSIIEAHPDLKFFEKVHAADALENAFLFGQVPARHDYILLKKAFGPRFAQAAFDPSKLGGFGHVAAEVLNIPRSLMASFDISAPFRQGLVAFATHPLKTGRNLGPMIKYLTSEKGYHAYMEELQNAPDFEQMQRDGLAITDVEHTLAAREEQFQSNYAEKITGGKYSPVRASGRAYTGFLVKTRVDIYRYLRNAAEKQGVDLEREVKAGKTAGAQLADYINAATGRGDLGRFERDAVTLNAFMFSPRLMASRLNFLNPFSYRGLDPFVRRQKIRAALQTAGAVGATLWLASHVPGVKVTLNPTNADFGKIRIGNTRIDVAGGFVQYIRFMGTLTMGAAASAHLTKGNAEVPAATMRFFRSKASPVTSMVTDFLTHTNYAGQPLPKNAWKKEIYDSFIPLVAQDVRDAYNQTGSIAAAIGAGAASGTGIGVQSYGAKATGPAPKTYGQKQQDWVTKATKAFGSLPTEVVDASHTKTLYHDALKHREDELGVKKLTDRQRTQLKLTILETHRPELASAVDQLKATIQQGGGDSRVLSAVDRYTEKALGWNLVDVYSREMNKLEQARGG